MMYWLLGLISFQVGAAISLKDAFQAARLNMESIKRADAAVAQREEQRIRARGAVLPNLSGVGTYTRIDPPPVGNGATGAFTLTQQYSYAARITQPLLRGGTISAYQLAGENVLLAQFQKNATELNLYQLVIASYYNLIIAKQDLKNLDMLRAYSQQRVNELRARTKIGRSRRGELVQAEAQLSTAMAGIQQGQISYQQAAQNFEFYTRLNPDDVGPLESDIPRIDGPLEAYVAKIKSRPDIMAMNQAVVAAERQINVSKGSHYPSVDFVGNYYFKRTGVLANSKYDLGLVGTIPLYQGGTVQAQVREAVELRRMAELDAQLSTRTAERDLAVLYQTFLQIQNQLKAAKDAMTQAEEAYRLYQHDNANGLVQNLDVIQTLNIYITNKRTYDSMYASAHMTYKNLEAATGALP